MATKRQGPMGLFRGASRPPRKSQACAAPPLASGPYAWDMVTDSLTWGPGAAEALGLSPRDLPKTGQAFAQLIEPGCGLAPHEAIAASEAPNRSYETRYALRLEPDRVVMIEDAGRWQPDVQGRPAFARGQLRVDPASGARDLLPVMLKERSALLCRIQTGINEALRVSQTCTLIVGAFDEAEAEAMADIARRLRPMMRRHDVFAALGPASLRAGAHLLPGCGCRERHEPPDRAPAGSSGRGIPAPGSRLRAGSHLQGDQAAALCRAGPGHRHRARARPPRSTSPAPPSPLPLAGAGPLRLGCRPQ